VYDLIFVDLSMVRLLFLFPSFLPQLCEGSELIETTDVFDPTPFDQPVMDGLEANRITPLAIRRRGSLSSSLSLPIPIEIPKYALLPLLPKPLESCSATNSSFFPSR
jgi:hypothetical protein